MYDYTREVAKFRARIEQNKKHREQFRLCSRKFDPNAARAVLNSNLKDVWPVQQVLMAY